MLSLDMMTNMSLLMKETTDTRTNDEVLADTRQMLTNVLEFNEQDLNGSYSFNQWQMFKLTWTVGTLYGARI